MNRRLFLQMAAAGAAVKTTFGTARELAAETGLHPPGRVENDYSRFLPGEREALAQQIEVSALSRNSARVKIGSTEKLIRPGEVLEGWELLAIAGINGSETCLFEKTVSHQGSIVYVTESEGVILRIPKGVGKLRNVCPRSVNTSAGVKFERRVPYTPGPDIVGDYILNSSEDPCYENVAALGPEYIGWTLVANEESGPERSLFLQADGKSRQLGPGTDVQALWAPDLTDVEFDPLHFAPGETPSLFHYAEGYSKRTLLGGYLPVGNTGVWNPHSGCGYEVIVLLPPGNEARAMARIRFELPENLAGDMRGEVRRKDGTVVIERFWNASPGRFYSSLAGIANHWQHFFEDNMQVDIPDRWLLDAARAGITLARCSYRGLEPTYQIGEGAYTKIPERSHALFPVAHYEFIWAHQLWNLTAQSDDYFQHYLDKYILPDGNFLYNTQDQVEAPLNTGVILWNSARAYDYTHNLPGLEKRLPVLRRMIDFVLQRYEYSKTHFDQNDRRYGLIWGSPEADLGDPENDFPNSHPFYFQNAAWTWRGLREHARCLAVASKIHNLPDLATEGQRIQAIADEIRKLIAKSLSATINASTPELRQAGITPFSPDDIHRKPEHLTSYENHRFMMDWFTADWGDPALDDGHFKHRELAGLQIMGMDTNGAVSRTSNFMEHGTLAGRIRQQDYRPFLLTLYGLTCYAADSGNRYAPEDAYLPGSFPGDGNPYQWSAVVNSVLQPALGLRWLLCYEESDQDICHLQKAAPKHWFAPGETIRVTKCPTRFGIISWATTARSGHGWNVEMETSATFSARILLHIHPPQGAPLRSSTAGRIEQNAVVIEANDWHASQTLAFQVE